MRCRQNVSSSYHDKGPGKLVQAVDDVSQILDRLDRQRNRAAGRVVIANETATTANQTSSNNPNDAKVMLAVKT